MEFSFWMNMRSPGTSPSRLDGVSPMNSFFGFFLVQTINSHTITIN
jgi:hypothetical protein